MVIPAQNTTFNSESSSSLWTADDVAIYLQLSPETVRVMARNGEIPSMKLGKRLWRFDPSKIKAWLQAAKQTRCA